MGYSTEFKGELKFIRELTASQLSEVSKFINEDCRDHPEWENTDNYYVDLELLKDFSGLKWNGAEKTYGMVDIVNMIIVNMSKKCPDFGLVGKLSAQGEDFDDRWSLVVNDGEAKREEVVIVGAKITCPNCEHVFIVEEAND